MNLPRAKMNLKELIDEDRFGGVFRVDRSAFTSAEVALLERANIFQRCWLYLGHDSEIPNAGGFRRRTVAGQPLFWVRGSDGRARVFYNSCTHWGANVCRLDEGNAELFQCFYHAWTFNNQGELVSVPDEAAYGEGFRKQAMGLASPPRVDNYRGLYFVSFNRDAEDLLSYLGDAKEYIDLILDQAEEGWRIVPGAQKYSVRANWKRFRLRRPAPFASHGVSRAAGSLPILAKRSRCRHLPIARAGAAHCSLAPDS